MSGGGSENAPDRQRLNQIIAEYLEAVESGRTPDRHELLDRYPDLADRLKSFFADHDRVKELAEPEGTLAHEAEAPRDHGGVFSRVHDGGNDFGRAQGHRPIDESVQFLFILQHGQVELDAVNSDGELNVIVDVVVVALADEEGRGPVDAIPHHHCLLAVHLAVHQRDRYQDGLGYYQSTRDTSTHFFMDYLSKGVYVFEYSTCVQHRGRYQTGIASIQCSCARDSSMCSNWSGCWLCGTLTTPREKRVIWLT